MPACSKLGPLKTVPLEPDLAASGNQGPTQDATSPLKAAPAKEKLRSVGILGKGFQLFQLQLPSSRLSLLFSQVSESRHHLLEEVCVSSLEVLIGLPRQLELHGRNLYDELLHDAIDDCPGNLGVAGTLCNSLLSRSMESYDNLHHPDGLGQWAHEVIVDKAVLLQEVLPNNLGYFQGALLVLGQGVLAYKLDNFLQVILLLQDLLHLLLEHAIFSVILLEERLQDTNVLGE
mmetsp:Transcript_9658/g.21535  ORF Transcript_9658/g.21535 Transcript_9658/m.21535 type:complete len:232 (-) Transcript_9658:1398-2093(-)